MTAAPFDDALRARAAALVATYKTAGQTIASAESCTGGLIAALLTEIAGSSAVVERGFVTYSNRAKTELLGVPTDLIAKFGAASAEVAQAMAEGALAHSAADVTIAVTGIAGPGGGSDTKPVGLVHLASATRAGRTGQRRRLFAGDRQAVRMAAVDEALSMLEQALTR